jgi:hypothetical protein
MHALRKLIPKLVTDFGGSKQKLAAAIGISPSGFSRLATTRPSLEVCLRLASVTGENPSRVLRAAGYGDVADLLEELYGHAAARRITRGGSRHTPREEQILNALRRSPKPTRRALELLIEAAAPDAPVAKVAPRPIHRAS